MVAGRGPGVPIRDCERAMSADTPKELASQAATGGKICNGTLWEGNGEGQRAAGGEVGLGRCLGQGEWTGKGRGGKGNSGLAVEHLAHGEHLDGLEKCREEPL